MLVLHEDPRTISILRRHVEECEFALAADLPAAQAAIGDLPDLVLCDPTWAEGCAAGSHSSWRCRVTCR